MMAGMGPRVFVKRSASAPAGFFTTEAAGLRWLAAAGGAPVVAPLEVGTHHLELEYIPSASASAQAAREFGAGLARIHTAGADAYGTLPPGAQQYFFGPLATPLALPTAESDIFGVFYADTRIAPVLGRALETGVADPVLAEAVDRVCRDLRAGRWDGPDAAPPAPARIHGDLWSGNLLWAPSGPVLIDPAACGGHPEADLAMLALFGAPHLEDIRAGYDEVSPPLPGRAQRVALHQLFPLLVHLLLFGRGYAAATRDAATALLES